MSLMMLNIVTAQEVNAKKPLISIDNLIPVNTKIVSETYLGKQTIKVTELDPGTYYKETIVKIKDLELKNGTIEVCLMGELSKNANAQARGFVGIAFRINEDNSKFESIYIRPTNSRSNDQLRRNHSVQYISHPDYHWYKLRKETPGKYETYVDINKDDLTKIKIIVKDNNATLYVNESEQPTLIVNDLKHAPANEGAIGLWISEGTIAHFSDLKITIDNELIDKSL